MNIFYLHKDPVIAASYMVDKHVVKMILETAQLLSTAHRILDGEEYFEETDSGRRMRRWKLFDNRENYLYKATHINHPSAIWCRESVSNYNWLSDHMFALLSEYTYRYEKEHKVQGYLSYLLQSPPFNLKKFEWTEMPCAMPDEYKISDDPVINYRQYYKYGKKDLHNWKKRDAPQWMQSWT